MIIDFHTHAFPDAIADRAVAALESQPGEAKACLDGRVSSLVASMDRHGIARSVLCSIATKPEQFERILKWSLEMASDRIVPFPSVHPGDPLAVERIGRIAQSGLRGVKLHPYYQDFDLDAESMMPIYERIAAERLILVCHTGFDLAFARVRRADPVRIRRVLDRVPGLLFAATHMGAWDDWDEVERHLLGRPIYMDTSYSLDLLPRDRARRLILEHPRECVLFGTDSPWKDQGDEIRLVRSLGLADDVERALLADNARRLLGGGR